MQAKEWEMSKVRDEMTGLSHLEDKLVNIMRRGKIVSDIDGLFFDYDLSLMSSDINWLLGHLQASLSREEGLLKALDKSDCDYVGHTDSEDMYCSRCSALASYRKSVGLTQEKAGE